MASQQPSKIASLAASNASCRSYGSIRDQARTPSTPPPGQARAAQQAQPATPAQDAGDTASSRHSALSHFVSTMRHPPSFGASQSSYLGLQQPRSRSCWGIDGPWLRGADAVFALSVGALFISNGGAVLAEGILAPNSDDAIVGGVFLGIGALYNLLSEYNVRRLIMPLGPDAPRALSGAHTLSNLALGGGSALMQVGDMQQQLSTELFGMVIYTAGWVGFEQTLSRIFEAMHDVRCLQEIPVEQLHSHGAMSTHDLLGNPWAFAGVLLGAYGLGRGLSAGSRGLVAGSAVLLSLGWLHNHRCNNPDNRLGLAITTVSAAGLGTARSNGDGGLALISGIALGLGAVFSLYAASSEPHLQAAAHHATSPEHIKVAHLPHRHIAGRAEPEGDVEARAARRA